MKKLLAVVFIAVALFGLMGCDMYSKQIHEDTLNLSVERLGGIGFDVTHTALEETEDGMIKVDGVATVRATGEQLCYTEYFTVTNYDDGTCYISVYNEVIAGCNTVQNGSVNTWQCLALAAKYPDMANY